MIDEELRAMQLTESQDSFRKNGGSKLGFLRMLGPTIMNETLRLRISVLVSFISYNKELSTGNTEANSGL